MNENKADKAVKARAVSIAKTSKRWASQVVVPEVTYDEKKNKVRFGFEEANKSLWPVIDEMIRLAAIDLKKEGHERPLQTLGDALFAVGSDPKLANNGLELITARAANGSFWYERFKLKDYDQEHAAQELKKRGLLRPKKENAG